MLLYPDRIDITWSCRCWLTASVTSLILCLVPSTRSTVWPPVFWNSSNSAFKTSSSSHSIQVELDDEVDFVCPFYSETHLMSDESQLEYYIIYQVSRKEYENCQVFPGNSARVVVNCSNPLQRKRFTILFEMFQAIPNVSEFESGSTYYYITTSTGKKDGLFNAHFGACYNRNMRLAVHVCCESSGDDADVSSSSHLTDSNRLWLHPPPSSRRTTVQLLSPSSSDASSVIADNDELHYVDAKEFLPHSVHNSLLNKSPGQAITSIALRLFYISAVTLIVAR